MSVVNTDGKSRWAWGGFRVETRAIGFLLGFIRVLEKKDFVDWLLLLTYPSVRLVEVAAFLNQLQQLGGVAGSREAVKLRKMLFMIVAAVHRANAPPMVLVVTVAYE